MRYAYIIILLLLTFKAMGQNVNNINKIEVYALEYNTLYITNVTKKDIKKNYDQYVRVLDDVKIQDSNLDKYIREMKSNRGEYLPQDYGAILIVHRVNKNKEIYYIASSYAGIVDEKGIVYKSDVSFISSIYSFFPDYFFIDQYQK